MKKLWEVFRKIKRCTMCGNKLDIAEANGNFSFQHRVGYGSKHDGDVVCLTLCGGCFDKVVDVLSMMSKEKIVFSPQELDENCGYYEKQVKVRGRYAPLTDHIGRQSRPFGGFSALKSKKRRRLQTKYDFVGKEYL